MAIPGRNLNKVEVTPGQPGYGTCKTRSISGTNPGGEKKIVVNLRTPAALDPLHLRMERAGGSRSFPGMERVKHVPYLVAGQYFP